MVRFKTASAIIFVLFIIPFNQTRAATSWHVKDAEYRLVVRETWRKKNTCLVRLPVEFHAWPGATAYTPEGHPVGCRPVLLDGKLLAVEVATSTRQQPGTIVSDIYIYPSAEMPTLSENFSLPVSCSYISENLVARPADCREMLQYIKTHKHPPFYRTLPKFPVRTYGIHLFFKSQPQTTQRPINSRKLKIRACLSTNLFTPSSKLVEFAIENNDTGPWYLFLNNKPAFSWGNGIAQANEGLRSIPIKTMPGLNRIDLFVVPSRTEMFPQIKIQHADKNQRSDIPETALFSSNECSSYQVDHREEGMLCTIKLALKPGIYYRESGKSSYPIIIKTVVSNNKTKPSFSIHNSPVVFDGYSAKAHLDGDITPLTITLPENNHLKTLTLPIRPDYFHLEERIVKLRLTDLPLFEPIRGALKLTYTIDVDHGTKPLSSNAQIILNYMSSDGTVLRSSHHPVPLSPFTRTMTLKSSVVGTAFVEMAVKANSTTLSNTIRTYVVSPDSNLKFTPDGGSFLHYQDGFAVLRRQHGTITLSMPKTDMGWGQASLVDGFIANSEHPLDPAMDVTEQYRDTILKHLPISQTDDQPAIQLLLCQVAAAIANESTTVIIAPPFDVINTLDFRDQRELMIFLAKSIRNAGKHLVFISIPDEGTLPRQKLRDFALMLKEIGRSFSIPIADLYSASLRLGNIADYWQLSQPGTTPIRTAVPNAKGQQWIMSNLSDVLDRQK
ncbi:hypothetical protein BVX99_02510 [bacterium F16]|nr:hypothetical protein BVX99_02510 [bacterium F16]